ncbi:DUF3052 family protein [Thermoleophilum album]|nr:DUF3052 family protein [Thermoleophilum album]
MNRDYRTPRGERRAPAYSAEAAAANVTMGAMGEDVKAVGELARRLGIGEGERVEVAGEIGADLRRELRAAIGRGFVRSGELDAAVVAVETAKDAAEALVRYRPRLRDTGRIWLVTPKRGGRWQLEQLRVLPVARKLGLIDNKTCSLDAERSAIRFVIPRALRAREAGGD